MIKYEEMDIVNDFEEIDLSRKYNIITSDEKFKRDAGKWLFNRDYNILGNLLSTIGEFNDDIKLDHVDSSDLQFNCEDVYGDIFTVYLFDEDKDNCRNFLVCKRSGDIGFYSTFMYNNRLFVDRGMHLSDDDQIVEQRHHTRKLAG